MGLFHNIPKLPEDPILGLTVEFNEDARDHKVLLAVGIYREEHSTNTRMKCVYEAEKKIVDIQPSKAYLPIDGNIRYLMGTFTLLFGHTLASKLHDKMAKIQTLGGTGALRIGCDFFVQNIGKKVHVSSPTWANHNNIFTQSGAEVFHYPYYDNATHLIRFDELKNYLNGLEPKEMIVLHTCCHNPTGVDFTQGQWKEIARIMKEKGLIAFFDTAYQGFGDGIDEDMFALRYFAEENVPIFIACSHSKSFGLYGERIGALYVLSDDEEECLRVQQNLKKLVRGNYSNPPRHGAAIVEHILHNEELKKLWIDQLGEYTMRLANIKKTLVNKLKEFGSKKDYQYFLDRKGLFCFTGLGKEQVIELREKFGIYMTLDGRMNVSGLNENNLEYVIKSMIQVGG